MIRIIMKKLFVSASKMRRRRFQVIATLILCSASSLQLPAAEIQMDVVHLGPRLRISDAHLERERDRLFRQDIFMPIPLLIYRIASEHQDFGPTVLASRLLNPSPEPRALVAREQDERVKLAILRELRFREMGNQLALYERLLQQEATNSVVEMALLDGLQRDADRFAEHALRLAVGGAEAAYPAGRSLAMRRFATQALVGRCGLDHPATLAALRYAITYDHFIATLAALEYIPDGGYPGLSAVALSRVLPEIRNGQRGLAWSIAMAALRRCRLQAESPLLQPLTEAVVGGELDLLHAVVAALRDGRVAAHPPLLAALRSIAASDPTVNVALGDLLGSSVGGDLPFAEFERTRARVENFSQASAIEE